MLMVRANNKKDLIEFSQKYFQEIVDFVNNV